MSIKVQKVPCFPVLLLPLRFPQSHVEKNQNMNNYHVILKRMYVMFYILYQNNYKFYSLPKEFLGEGVLKCMQQIYRTTPKLKCDFNKAPCNFIEISLHHRCSPVNVLHIFQNKFFLRIPLDGCDWYYMRKHYYQEYSVLVTCWSCQLTLPASLMTNSKIAFLISTA